MSVNNLTYSKDGLALTELFEGDILTAYQDQKGVWTIGYGHTAVVQPGQTDHAGSGRRVPYERCLVRRRLCE